MGLQRGRKGREDVPSSSISRSLSSSSEGVNESADGKLSEFVVERTSINGFRGAGPEGSADDVAVSRDRLASPLSTGVEASSIVASLEAGGDGRIPLPPAVDGASSLARRSRSSNTSPGTSFVKTTFKYPSEASYCAELSSSSMSRCEKVSRRKYGFTWRVRTWPSR